MANYFLKGVQHEEVTHPNTILSQAHLIEEY